MANSREYQFLYTKIPLLTLRAGNFTLGGSGSVATSTSGTGGLSSVTKLGTGIYQLQFKDNFNAYVGSRFTFQAGTSGANVGDGTLVSATLYQIVTVGNTDWGSVGLIGQYGTAVGMSFVASGTGDGAKTGVAKAIAAAGAATTRVEVITPAAYLKNLLPNMNTGTAGLGSSIIIRCMGPTDGTNTASVAVSPAAGCVLEFDIMFRNSTAQAV